MLVRADAGVAIGTGHVMRCVALAQAWQDRGGRAHFVGRFPETLRALLAAQKFSVTDLKATPGSAEDADALLVVANASDPSWIVVDGEIFSTGYFLHFRSERWRVLAIDDLVADRTLPVDAVLNQNFNATQAGYATRAGQVELLLGSEYLLLRREFRNVGRRVRVSTRARTIFLSGGGTDPDNLCQRVLQACARTPDFQIKGATSSTNPHLQQLREFCSAAGLRVELHVDAPNLAELMASADIAVIAAGGTLWELLCLGCPVLSYSRNRVQAQVIDDLAAASVVKTLGPAQGFEEGAFLKCLEHVAASAEEREAMATAGRRLVDGRGAERVVDRLLQIEAKV